MSRTHFGGHVGEEHKTSRPRANKGLQKRVRRQRWGVRSEPGQAGLGEVAAAIAPLIVLLGDHWPHPLPGRGRPGWFAKRHRPSAAR